MKMNDENLKPVRNKTEARERGKKGGLVKSDAKKYSVLKEQSKKALCKNCKAECVLKEENKAKLQNFMCNIPDARAKAIWYNMPVMDENLLEKLDRQALLKLVNMCKDSKEIKMLHDAIMNKKKIDYPKVQQHKIEQSTVVISYKDLQEMYEKYN